MRKPLQCILGRPLGSSLSSGHNNRSSEALPTSFSPAVMFLKTPFMCVWAPYLISRRISEQRNSFCLLVSPISLLISQHSWPKLIHGLIEGCCIKIHVVFFHPSGPEYVPDRCSNFCSGTYGHVQAWFKWMRMMPKQRFWECGKRHEWKSRKWKKGGKEVIFEVLVWFLPGCCRKTLC